MSDIKLFFSFLKANAGWLFFSLFLGFMMDAVMLLNQIPLYEVVYGMGICLFLLAVMVLFCFLKFLRGYRKLLEAEGSIAITLDGLKQPENRMEEEYCKLLAIVFHAKIEEQNRSEQRMRDFKEYFTMWVHQIKTPISAMRLLLQDKSGEADRTEELDELFRMEQYVEMALQYMRLDAESTDFLLRRMNLDSAIKESVHKYARMFIRKKIKLEYTDVNAYVLTDEKWIVFVIEQILSNAIKYTPDGVVSIFMEKENVLVIEDTGIGICEEDLPRIFEKGYTGYNGHADKRSTGIGLFLCSKILKKLSHGIKIESEPGKGTKVFLMFPEEKDQI